PSRYRCGFVVQVGKCCAGLSRAQNLRLPVWSVPTNSLELSLMPPNYVTFSGPSGAQFAYVLSRPPAWKSFGANLRSPDCTSRRARSKPIFGLQTIGHLCL